MGTLRLMLALAVAVGHFRGPFLLIEAHYAVQVFYIFSGFLISSILAEKYEGRVWLFYTNRAARILIPYWAAFLLAVAVCLPAKVGFIASLSAVAGSFDLATWSYAAFTNALILGQDLGLFLGWSADTQLYWTTRFSESSVAVWKFQAIPQAWSVSVELWFYLLAPFVLRRHVAVLAAIACSAFAARTLASDAGLDRDPWTYRFFPFELTWFLLGAISQRFSRHVVVSQMLDRMPRSLPMVVFVAAVALLSCWGRVPWISEWSSRTTVVQQPVGLFVAVAIALPALFRFSFSNQWDRRLGDLSYPIYIVHYTAIWGFGAWNILPELGPWRHLVATMVLSVLIAVAVERPVDRWRQRRVARASRPGPGGPVPQAAQESA